MVPPLSEAIKRSTSSSIISILRLLYAVIFKLVDEWGYGDGVHGHGERVALSGAFLGVECASIYEQLVSRSRRKRRLRGTNEQLGIFSVGVDDDY